MTDRVMCKASEIGKIIVNKCLDKGLFINTQKLQKLLVLVQVECIKQTGTPFFEENIVVWDCGVVIPEVDRDFIDGGIQITRKYTEYINLLTSEEKIIDYIIDAFGNFDIFELNRMPDCQKIIRISTKSNGCLYPSVATNILVGVFSNF